MKLTTIKNFLRLNWRATICLNYHIGGLGTVLRMPVKVYGRLKCHVTGKIILPENAIRNTLIIGSEHEDYTASAGSAEVNIRGTWRINGIVRIGHDCFVGVAENATLSIGDGCMIGRDSEIHCSNTICLEDRILAGKLYVTDSSEHPIITNGQEKPMLGEIRIGHSTYFSHGCTVLKGTVIPPHSVVAAGAVCTKDFSSEGNSHLFIAGVPATVKHHDTMCKM